MRKALPLILALTLGAAASLPPRPDADPVSLIAAIYRTYENDTPALPHIYSKRLQALVDKDARETPKGELGRIDWDMFVDGQVWKLSKLKIALVSKSAGQAEVRATFMNYSEPNTMLFELVSEGGRLAHRRHSKGAEAALEHVENPDGRPGCLSRCQAGRKIGPGRPMAKLGVAYALPT